MAEERCRISAGHPEGVAGFWTSSWIDLTSLLQEISIHESKLVVRLSEGASISIHASRLLREATKHRAISSAITLLHFPSPPNNSLPIRFHTAVPHAPPPRTNLSSRGMSVFTIRQGIRYLSYPSALRGISQEYPPGTDRPDQRQSRATSRCTRFASENAAQRTQPRAVQKQRPPQNKRVARQIPELRYRHHSLAARQRAKHRPQAARHRRGETLHRCFRHRTRRKRTSSRAHTRSISC